MRFRNRFNQTTVILAFAMASLFPLTGSSQLLLRPTDNATVAPLEAQIVDPNPKNAAPPKDQPPRFEPVPDEAFLDREPAWSSEEDQSRPSRPTRRPSVITTQSPMRAREVRRTIVQTVYEPIPAEELAAARKIQEAIASLKSAKDDDARKSATAMIQEQLNSQFDRDVEQREKELVEVEQRVKTLREQLDKRKSLRDDIVGLRLKTIQNDAKGLGFPGGGNAADSMGIDQAYAPEPTDEARTRDSSDAHFFGQSSTVPANGRAAALAQKESTPRVTEGFQVRQDDSDVFIRDHGDSPVRGDSDERRQIDTDVRLVIGRLMPGKSIMIDEYRSLIRFVQFVQHQRDGYEFETAFQEIRKILDMTFDPAAASMRDDAFVRVVAWAKDRSSDNRKLEGFSLLRWYYPPERWTKILEAVRKLDPALANETDVLLAPFLKPEAEASKDKEKPANDDSSIDPKR